MAPCPMCHPDKFLGGRLCWFPGLQCCAIIGHCCADKTHSAEAERRFKEASVLRWQEDDFLAAFPLVPTKIATLMSLRPKAEEALRLHRKFRKSAAPLMMLLRDQVRGDGRLLVHYEIALSATGEGPQGFRGRERVFDTHDYGVLDGSVAIRAKYDPLAEIDTMLASLRVWNAGDTEGDVIDAIASMNEAQRRRGYAVLTNIDHKLFPALRSKLDDFERFFEPDNMKRLNLWGGDARNAHQIEASARPIGNGVDQVRLFGAGCLAVLLVADVLHTPIPEWSAVAKKT